MNTVEIVKLVSLCLTYGTPAVLKLIELMGKENVTLEDIEAMSAQLKRGGIDTGEAQA